MNTASQPPTSLPSLLDEPTPAAGSQTPAAPQAPRKPNPIARLRSAVQSRLDDPSRRPAFIKRARIAGAVLVIGASVGAYFVLRPVPQPDYLKDSLDSVFDYTLLTDEFNNLPVEKRLELMGLLVQRLKSMSSGDSALLAGFAAGIAGSARAQIEKNISILIVDSWDKYAKDYDKVLEKDRGEFLDKTFLDMVKTMEAVTGQPRNIPDEKRLAEVKSQTKKNKDMLNDPNRAPDAKSMGGMLSFMNTNLGGRSSPAQRARGSQLMRDMTQHFREEK